MSTIPVVSWTPETVRTLNDLNENAQKRLAEGRQLVLLTLCNKLRKLIQEKAPKLEFRGKKKTYANQLEIGWCDELGKHGGVFLYFKDSKRKFNPISDKRSILIIQPIKGSKPFVQVLAKYNPWPADMIPLLLEKRDANVIIRPARMEEIAKLKRKLRTQKRTIERELKSKGLPNIGIGEKTRGDSLVVHDDVAYTVLRDEFGFKERRRAHWRPALKELMNEIPVVNQMLATYIQTGDRSVFDLPSFKVVSMSDMKSGQAFQRMLMPFVPKG